MPVHANDVLTSLERDVFPNLGPFPLSKITPPMILSVLRLVENRGSVETARRLRQRVSAVFVHGIAEGWCENDPAAIIGRALKTVPRPKKTVDRHFERSADAPESRQGV